MNVLNHLSAFFVDFINKTNVFNYLGDRRERLTSLTPLTPDELELCGHSYYIIKRD